MSASKQWSDMYARWKAGNPTAKDETRHRLVRGCIRKMAYRDFLIAILAARSLQADKKDADNVNIYHCSLCNMAHIGNRKGKIKFVGCRESAE